MFFQNRVFRLLVISFVGLVFCTSVEARVAKRLLSREDAQYRSKRISNVHYDLKFHLEKTETLFTGVSTLSFDLKKVDPVTVDFSEGKVTRVTVNGKSIPVQYNQFFISIPKEFLRKGANRVAIEFEQNYSRTGSGLYRFEDPVDKRVYTYTDFQPYDSNRLFPCFDQPDLKATYTVEVNAPRKWEVVTSIRESKTKRQGKRKIWNFPKSKKFSTYIFSLHSGEYKKWSSVYQSGKRKIPLRLYVRQSFAKHVKPSEWFRWTKQGFSFFESYFDYPYPYTKYDQLIVPDFNAGAMENVGAVTFTERLEQRGESSAPQKERRANIIRHEMAHMWFGNLVTMKWWDDLWLNESFATYMAVLALVEATEFKNAWQTFFVSDKGWGYWEDQLVTTHPIQAKVPDTDQAFANFDGITYGKGAATLKQLNFYLGPNQFRKGVRNYFKKYAYQNTVLDDFIGSLSKASGKDLDDWTEEWLQEAGLNQIAADYECHQGKIKDFEIIQSSVSGSSTKRTHRTQIAFYDVVNQSLKKRKAIAVTYSGSSTEVPLMNGQDCPAVIALNDEDHDYVKTKLDPRTLSHLKVHISKVHDPLLEMMLWESLWNMVRDGEFSLIDFSNLMISSMSEEKDIQTATRVIQKFYGRRLHSASVLAYFPMETQKQRDLRRKFNGRFEALSWALLKSAKPGSDFQKLWFDSFVSVAERRSSFKKLIGFLTGSEKIRGLKIDQDRRWAIIQRLHRIGYPRAGKYLQIEEKRDPSHFGKKAALASRVIQPDLRLKKKWMAELHDEKTKRSVSELKVIMRNIFPPEQDGLKSNFDDEFYQKVTQYSKARKAQEYLDTYTYYITPALCSLGSTINLKKYLDKNSHLLASYTEKNIKIAIDGDERYRKIKSLAETEITTGKQIL